MAESILFNIVERILVSLGQHALQEVVSCLGARRELEKLENTVRFIQARVHDAERRREEESSEVIKEWLGRLSQVLYRADDLFDEVCTAVSCREQQAYRSKLAKQVSIVFSSSNPFSFNRKMAQEIKSIREELDDIKSNMDGLNLRVCLTDQEPVSRLLIERETISFVQVDSVIGRDFDKNKILDMLFDPKYANEDVSVIPIVGFGGLGKTTLAQLVFNDERVKSHFDLAKWACVPEISNPKEVVGKTLQAFTGMNYHDLSREEIQSQIRLAVKDKIFLLVLDDIWDESRERWLELVSLLKCGKQGSKLIVTTRSDVVATVVGTVPEPYKLGLLTPEDSWNLFKLLAFKKGQEDSNPTLVEIGKEIIENCGNVPLAIRVVGSLLYSKHSEKEWEMFRDAQRSKAKLIDLNNIMPVLKLSYDYLPSALKQCFAYCSLFPKDYEFENTELVQLWMAQGYVEPFDASLGMEDVADQYFVELLRRNLFQDVKDFYPSNVIRCKMHDLVHDLAQHVAGNGTIVIDESRVQSANRLVHVNVWGRIELKEALQPLLAARNLRSLLLKRNDITSSTFKELVSRFASLRALNSDSIEKVPSSIGRLRHLRYLNLSHSPTKNLPSDITRLHNLQTLNLDHCRELRELPRGFSKLSNLRHLGILECPFTDMPQNFRRMKSLRELNRFVVGKNNGLDALADLNLRGRLRIVCQRWRANIVLETQLANFKEKKQLTSFSFCFRYKEQQSAVSNRDEESLLESLQLPPSLKDLHFSGLGGNNFPRGMLHELTKLVEIYIQRCDNCQVLPIFSRLPLLKYLSFEGLKALEYVETDDFSLTGRGSYFPVLESLTLNFMPELKRWSKVENLGQEKSYVFHRLKRLQILGCRKLMTIPFMPQVESMNLCSIHGELLNSILTSNQIAPSSPSSTPKLRYLFLESIELVSLDLSSQKFIKELSINDCGSLRNICDGMECLVFLEELRIYKCEDLDACAWEGLKSLHTLQLSDMPKVDQLPQGITRLPTLHTLCISSLGNLTALPEKMGGMSHLQNLTIINLTSLTVLPEKIRGMSHLQQLSIMNLTNLTALPEEIGGLQVLQCLTIATCPKLTSIPHSLHGLTSLQKLIIHECPELEKRCEQPNGEDWPLIQHIPTVKFQLYP